MKLLAMSIVTASLVAGDIIEDMGLMPGQTSTWAWCSTVALVWFILEVARTPNKEK